MNRLENDRSLARFAGQFVPLKLVTDDNPEWRKWSSKYRVDGNAIPILYVIRADGEKLYGAAGSLNGDKLPQMMTTVLQEAGRTFSDAQAATIHQAVSAAKLAFDSQDILAAATSLATMSSLGELDSIGSYAEPAKNAESLYRRFLSELESSIQEANDDLVESEDAFSAIVSLLEAEAAMKAVPALKSKSNEVAKELRQNKSLAAMIARAELLLKAKAIAASPQPRIRVRAAAAYGSVLRKFPGSDAALVARARLEKLDPKSKFLKVQSPGSETPKKDSGYRQWEVADGSFSTLAKYIQQKDGKVQLLKKDGKKIVVDIAILSDVDQSFLRSAR